MFEKEERKGMLLKTYRDKAHGTAKPIDFSADKTKFEENNRNNGLKCFKSL